MKRTRPRITSDDIVTVIEMLSPFDDWTVEVSELPDGMFVATLFSISTNKQLTYRNDWSMPISGRGATRAAAEDDLGRRALKDLNDEEQN